jgi:endonuclease-3 related protein
MSGGGAASEDGTTARLLAVYQSLDRMHAWRGWHWWPDADPFEVSVGAILVQNTSWTNVERALDRLRAAGALSAPVMSALAQTELEELVRPSGQYRQKAKKLRAFLSLVERHGSLEALFALPADVLRQELLGTWGIGEETADAIAVYAARQPAFVIDAYTRRIFERLALGPSPAASYQAWQRFFATRLAESAPAGGVPGANGLGLRDFWARYHALVVLHAKHLCRKRAPRCDECELAACCPGSPASPRPGT